MSRSLRLRRWQKEALDLLDTRESPDFLAVATPGAGKTTFALAAVLRWIADDPRLRVVVVVPTSHLKVQWSRAAAALGLHLEPSWSSQTGSLPSDMHGIVVTYQQVASNPEALRRNASHCVVVLDELHHTGEERAWGDAVRHAFDPAVRRLSVSGTPFRSDTHAIPFVRYVADQALADYEYGYREALADRRVVRPVYFPTIGGFMEWTAPDGTTNAATFDDALDLTRSSQRLRTALSLESDWLPTVLGQAHERLRELRLAQSDAAGLVVASDQAHAHGIARLMQQRYRVAAMVVTSDDPMASQRIASFADGNAPWLIAVRMVSEGVDIPRLRLGVFATTVTTELFFRQVVGRFVRHTGGAAATERAWLFIPDDPRLRQMAASIAEQRRHSLRRTWEEGETPDDEADPTALDEVPGEQEQMSLFEVLSASVTDSTDSTSVFDPDPALDGVEDDEWDTSVDVVLPPPPLPSGARRGGESDGRPLAEVKRELRDVNSALVRELVLVTALSHREVNGRLNQSAAISRIADATADQLRARAAAAERWLANL
ncbi:MAG: DEAD/DEAH box helicase [Acidimicrobiales bacterium]